MYKVQAFTDSNGTHLHQLYSGLHLLAKAGKIELQYCTGKGLAAIRPNRQFLELAVLPPQGLRWASCIFDLQDSPEIGAPETLPRCDLYFKRSYQKSVVQKLGLQHQQKIRPYGLNYQVLETNLRELASRIYYEFKSAPFNPFAKRNGFHVRNLLDLMRDALLPYRDGCTLFPANYFEQLPSSASKKQILFQCRLWEPSSKDMIKRTDMEAINHDRVTLIRKLRKEFGPHFIGGLQPTKYALDNHSDLISQMPTRRSKYIELVKSSMVVVCTSGLLQSTGWKFGENVAAARCIVSEPLHNEVPGDFSAPANYLSFTSPDECIEACYRLISDDELALSMRTNNYRYYQEHVRPDSLIMKCLQQISSELN